MIAKVSRQDPQAAENLNRLAKEGNLSTSDLQTVAATLGGSEYQLITAGSDIALRSKAATQLNGRAPETWTDVEIDQRLSMINQLLLTDPEPAAAEALTAAQERLLVWRERPMIDGVRVKAQ